MQLKYSTYLERNMLSPAPRVAPAPARMEGGTYLPVDVPAAGKSAVGAGVSSSPTGGVSEVIGVRIKIEEEAEGKGDGMQQCTCTIKHP
jgi:hypothetical protein